MSSQIQLALGAAPWRPSPDARLIKEYARYDMPLSGLIEQAGRTYLFECVEGVGMDVNVWAYTPITSRNIMRLNRLDGENLTEAIGELLESARVTVALVAEDQVVTGTVIEEGELRSDGILKAAISRIRQALRRDLSIADALATA